MLTTKVFLAPIGAFMMKRTQINCLAATGIAIMSVSVYMASKSTSWNEFKLWYGCGFASGVGFVYWTPINAAWEWFPEQKGLVTGLVISGYGFGAFIFGFVTTAIVNPDNLRPEVPKDGSGDTDKLFPESVAD